MTAQAKKLEAVRWLAEHGNAEQKRRARFYLSVIRPTAKEKNT